MARTTDDSRKKSPAKAGRRWAANCKAAVMLREAFENGTVSPNVLPKDVYDTSPEYQKYSLVTFRNHLYKMRGEMGLFVRKGKYYMYTRT